jgi:PPP family 3-phenylpropionic acid transporter
MTLLGEHRDQYGSQRLWGAIGWGLAGPTAGWLTGAFGLHWSFIGYLVLMSAGLIIAWKLPVSAAPPSRPFWAGMRFLLADQRWLIFLLIAFLSGAGLSVVTNFLFLYMEELNASRQVMGLALLMATISEIPVLFFSGKMLRRWGPRGLLLVSLAAYVLRAYAYAAASAPWQVLIIQLFHGLTFSTMWVAGVSLAQEIAPPGLGATAQGLFSSTVMGFGGITGALVGGLLLQYFGGAGMYFWSGTAVLFGLLLFLTLGTRLNGVKSPAG